MSDVLTPEQLDTIRSRDSRFAAIGRAIAIEADLRDNETIKALLGAVRADMEAGLDELADLSPGDPMAVAAALVKVRTFVWVRRTLNLILQHGAAAEAAVRAEDHREDDE